MLKKPRWNEIRRKFSKTTFEILNVSVFYTLYISSFIRVIEQSSNTKWKIKDSWAFPLATSSTVIKYEANVMQNVFNLKLWNSLYGIFKSLWFYFHFKIGCNMLQKSLNLISFSTKKNGSWSVREKTNWTEIHKVKPGAHIFIRYKIVIFDWVISSCTYEITWIVWLEHCIVINNNFNDRQYF